MFMCFFFTSYTKGFRDTCKPGTPKLGHMTVRKRVCPGVRKESQEKSEQKRLSNSEVHSRGGGCTCVKMEPFVLLAFFPHLIVFFASKLDIVPLKCSVLGVCKGPFCGRKGQMVVLGSRTQKQPKCLQNKGKPNDAAIGSITRNDLKLNKYGQPASVT